MKGTVLIILFTLFTISTVSGQTANKDKAYFSEATRELADHNCDKALLALNKVSLDGKDSARYLLLMTRVHECAGSYEQALYFYRKYADTHPAGDTTDQHMARLQQLAALHKNDEPRNALLKEKALHSSSYGVGGSYSFIMGGSGQKLFHRSSQVVVSTVSPVMDDRMCIGAMLAVGNATDPDKEWFAQVFNTYAGNVKVSTGIVIDFSLQPMWVFSNTHRWAVMAGPSVGFIVYASNDLAFNNPIIFDPEKANITSLTLGLKARILYKKVFTAFAGFDKLMIRSVDGQDQGSIFYSGQAYTVPVRMATFTLGVGVYLVRE